MEMVKQTKVDAVAVASLLHYDLSDVRSIKEALRESGVEVSL